MEGQPQMTQEEQRKLIAFNRKRFCAPAGEGLIGHALQSVGEFTRKKQEIL
jgi:hypothetical protein